MGHKQVPSQPEQALTSKSAQNVKRGCSDEIAAFSSRGITDADWLSGVSLARATEVGQPNVTSLLELTAEGGAFSG